jgi:hypothetical protein
VLPIRSIGDSDAEGSRSRHRGRAHAGFASPASAAIKITKIYCDSPGADTGTNKSLNAEYVVIKNTGTTRKALTGWTLRDASKHVYKFPTFRLGAGKRPRSPDALPLRKDCRGPKFPRN